MSTRSLFCVAVVSAVSALVAPIAAQAQGAEGLASTDVNLLEAPYKVGTLRGCDSFTTSPSLQNKIDKLLNQNGSQFLAPSIELTDEIKSAQPQKAPMVIIVDKDKHFTHVLQNHDGMLVEVFRAPNATGKRSTPTPSGRMMIAEKRWDPEWKPPVSIDPQQKKVESWTKNKHNPLGVAWMGLNQGCIGLHGTCAPTSIGRNASHGCVRHKNEDIKKLFSLVPVGTPVYIVPKYAGTKLLADDVEYLNGGSSAMVAHVDLSSHHI